MKKVFFIAVLFTSVIACATGPQIITTYDLNLNPSISDDFEKDNLILKVHPVVFANHQAHPSLYTPIKWGRSKSGDYYRDSNWILFYPPGFKITITNNTGHVIKFNRAVFKLEDDAGNLYDCLTKQDLFDINNNAVIYYAQSKEMYFDQSVIHPKISQLRLIDNNFELLPGYTQSGYMCFNLPPMFLTNQEFIVGKQFVKLLMFEIPVEMDEAGKVKKTTQFKFVYDVVSESKTIN